MIKLIVNDPNYCATVVRVNSLVPLKGLDNLVQFPCFGFSALVGKDTEVGQLGILFTAETQLSEEFASFNNLFRHSDKNKDPEKVGYLEDSCRVRTITLRKHPSSAIFVPLSSIAYLGDPNELKEGDCFNEIDGKMVCQKYVVKQTNSSKGPNASKNKELRKSRIESKLMPEHVSTSHYLKCENVIDDNTDIVITAKLHGCVHHSTIIDTETGSLTIKEIVDGRLPVKIKAYDINKHENVFVNIDEYYLKKDTTDWYEIETEDGRILKITGNNPVWLPELNCYRNTEDLVVGDILLVD